MSDHPESTALAAIGRTDERTLPRWARIALGLLICYAAFITAIGPRLLWRPGVVLHSGMNFHVAEARAWLDGRLDLPERQDDTALYQDRIYVALPPAFTLFSLAALPWSPAGVPLPMIVALLVLPLPGLAYWLFLRQSAHPWTATLLTLAYLIGTSLLPVTTVAVREGFEWHLNHLVSQLGLLLLLLDIFACKRIWPGAVGLALAVWSRQLTVAYALPFVAMAWTSARPDRRSLRAILAIASVAVVIALPLVLNALKFGSPLDSGYAHIYAGRSDRFAREAQHGLFSVSFIPRNLYYLWVGFPRFAEVLGHWHWVPNNEATGIWWTSPILVFLIVLVPRVWRTALSRIALVAVGLIWMALLCYHNTGAEQRGFNRFSLDTVPVMLALIAPYCHQGWYRFAAPLAVGWSIVYFNWIL